MTNYLVLDKPSESMRLHHRQVQFYLHLVLSKLKPQYREAKKTMPSLKHDGWGPEFTNPYRFCSSLLKSLGSFETASCKVVGTSMSASTASQTVLACLLESSVRTFFLVPLMACCRHFSRFADSNDQRSSAIMQRVASSLESATYDNH